MIYMGWFPSKNLPDHRTFGCLHRKLCASEWFYASRCDTGTGRYCRTSTVKIAILCTVKESPSKGSRTAGCKPFLCHIHEMHVTSFAFVLWSMFPDIHAENANSSQQDAFIHWTQQSPLQSQHCISALTFLY